MIVAHVATERLDPGVHGVQAAVDPIGDDREHPAVLRTELIDRIDTVKADLSADNADIRNDLRRMDDRLRAVEIAFGKVDQRLETLERLHRPAPEPGA